MLDYIVNVPSLIYLKAPVGTLNELYTRYPDGGEYGWFSLVIQEKTFAWWNNNTRKWELIKTEPGGEPGGEPGEDILDLYNSKVLMIDTGDFIPVNPQRSGAGYEYQITPGSYGVIFTDAPIEGLSDVNFNLKVDYVSHDGSGGDGNQDFIHTLTTATGRVFTRRVYMDNQQVGYVSTQFVENASGSTSGGSLTISSTAPLNPTEGDVWIDDFIRYTYTNNKWIEI